MIKFLMFVMLLFSPKFITAESWSSEIITDSSKFIEESEVRYKFYKEEFKYSVYEEISSDYIGSYDLNDFTYTDYSSWKEEYPSYKYGRIVEEKEEVITYDSSKFNYITFHNFNLKALFKLVGIYVQNKDGENIDFEIIFSKDNEEYLNIVPNTHYKTGVKIDDDLVIKLKFNEHYNTSDVIVSIHFKSFTSKAKNFDFSFTNDEIYHTKTKTIETKLHNHMDNDKSTEEVITDSNDFTVVNSFSKKLYRYKDALFKREVYEKVYLDEYYKELEGYTKDTTTAKVFYKYKDKNEVCAFNGTISNESITKDASEIIEENDENLALIDKKIALNDKKNNDYFIYYLLYGCIFIVLGFILLLLYIFLKKIIEKCRAK